MGELGLGSSWGDLAWPLCWSLASSKTVRCVSVCVTVVVVVGGGNRHVHCLQPYRPAHTHVERYGPASCVEVRM